LHEPEQHSKHDRCSVVEIEGERWLMVDAAWRKPNYQDRNPGASKDTLGSGTQDRVTNGPEPTPTHDDQLGSKRGRPGRNLLGCAADGDDGHDADVPRQRRFEVPHLIIERLLHGTHSALLLSNRKTRGHHMENRDSRVSGQG
jgi:hypothetical protein